MHVYFHSIKSDSSVGLVLAESSFIFLLFSTRFTLFHFLKFSCTQGVRM